MATLEIGIETVDNTKPGIASANKALRGIGNTARVAAKAVAIGAAAGAAALATVTAAAFNVSNETQKAAKNIETQLGTTTEEAKRLADVARNVYGNNFAGSVGEASDCLLYTSPSPRDS